MLKRKITYTYTTRIPLKAVHASGIAKSRHERYHLRRRGTIAKMLKPKKVT